MPPKAPPPPPGAQTVVYNIVQGHELKLDYWLPRTPGKDMPVFVIFHGGGMTAGTRKGDVTDWIYRHCQSKGYLLISADYRLLVPSTALDMIDDACALITYISSPFRGFQDHLPKETSINSFKIVVSGFSAGAYPARAATLYADPRPACLLSVFGLGGDLISDQWTNTREEYLPMAKFFDMATVVPELLSNKEIVTEPEVERFPLTMQFEKDGQMLDYCFGIPGLGKKLAGLPYEERKEHIPSEVLKGFFQFHLDNTFPPSVFIHGTTDRVVLAQESEHQHKQLVDLGVESKLLLVEGAGHGLMEGGFESAGPPKPAVGAEDAYKQALEFIDRALQ